LFRPDQNAEARAETALPGFSEACHAGIAEKSGKRVAEWGFEAALRRARHVDVLFDAEDGVAGMPPRAPAITAM
jgi:hypothetical protein